MQSPVCLLLIPVFCIQTLKAQLEEDKAMHFAAGAVSGSVGAMVASEISDKNKYWTLAGSVLGSLLAGSVKEAIDQQRYNGWDNADLGATVLGGISAGVTINLFTGKSRKPKLRQEVFLARQDSDPYSMSYHDRSIEPKSVVTPQ